MNPRIFVGVAVAIVAATVAIIAFSGQSIIDDTAGDGASIIVPSQNPPPSASILPLTVDLEMLEITEVDQRSATIDLKLRISNPNQRSVILQLVKYQVFEDNLRIHAGQIGDRFEGFVEGSNFYTVLAGSHTTLSDRIVLRNTGNAPELWEALSGNTPDWRITGEGFFNLSSITAGGENSFTFEFDP